jgi:hypothetical protein
MSDPFSGMPDPRAPRPIRRPSQPGVMHEALQAMREVLRSLQDRLRPAVPATQRALLQAKWHSRDLWLRGKRHPRTLGVVGGAVALTLVGAYALSASGAGRSLCPSRSDRKAPPFVLLMDQVPQVAAGSKVEIHYDVCGLPSGAPYSGQVRLVPQRAAGKKKSAKPKPLTISFKDETDGVATRRQQELELRSTRPGAYTLELSIADKQGRERTKVQKVVIKAR